MSSPSPTADRPSQAKILTVLFVPLFMALLSVSIVNVALPSIDNALEAGQGALQWVLSGYALAFGVVLVGAGRAGDLWGRSKLFNAGLAIFVIGALFSGLANSIELLNVARMLTGIGAGMLNPQIIGMIQQEFDGEARAKAYGIFGAVIGLAVSVGPVIGGLIIDGTGPDLGWRLTFWINSIVGALGLFLAFLWLPKEEPTKITGGFKKLDPLGAVLLALTVIGILLPASSQDPLLWLGALAAVIFLLLWIWWENRLTKFKASPHNTHHEPMVDMRLFKIPAYTIGTANVSLFLGGMTSIWAVLAIFAQQGLGQSALVAGLLGLPSAVMVVISSPFLGKYVYSHGKKIVLWGVIISLVSLLVSALIAPSITAGQNSVWWLAVTTAPIGVGQAMVLNTSQTLLMAEVPVQLAGAAGGFSQTMQRVFTSLGLMFITGLFFAIATGQGDWGRAVTMAFFATIGFWVVTAILAGYDLWKRPPTPLPDAAAPAEPQSPSPKL
ncbi:MFS transporter [Micrococcoides hystricis]|uniref:MFS transporter n=1 Tax=Micrococcoides hystricis TaxID=1572761 RepID=A0ABV6P965_9MICC